MNKIYIEKKVSDKTKKEYHVVYIDFGYRQLTISYDIAHAVELSGMTYAEVSTMEVGKPLCLGSIVPSKEGK